MFNIFDIEYVLGQRQHFIKMNHFHCNSFIIYNKEGKYSHLFLSLYHQRFNVNAKSATRKENAKKVFGLQELITIPTFHVLNVSKMQ